MKPFNKYRFWTKFSTPVLCYCLSPGILKFDGFVSVTIMTKSQHKILILVKVFHELESYFSHSNSFIKSLGLPRFLVSQGHSRRGLKSENEQEEGVISMISLHQNSVFPSCSILVWILQKGSMMHEQGVSQKRPPQSYLSSRNPQSPASQ